MVQLPVTTNTSKSTIQIRIMGTTLTMKLSDVLRIEDIMENRIRAFAGAVIGNTNTPLSLTKDIKEFIIFGD